MLTIVECFREFHRSFQIFDDFMSEICDHIERTNYGSLDNEKRVRLGRLLGNWFK